jgi:hypothetical protein
MPRKKPDNTWGRDKHEANYNDPYTPGESARWLAAHLKDVANKRSKPTRIRVNGGKKKKK